ncbi:HNH endonuclease signature motif containing protein [Streptomyces sp. NPDC049590]|uniref:HNH endonuclease n=1 Tax=Streptomyces sp. NPDC049590 TaxID=3154834 RepID=UPI00343BFA54
MALTDITRVEIEKAMAECDRLGREAFLAHHGFRPARQHLLLHHGRRYDSKAILGAAHGYLPGRRPLAAAEFSGGAKHAVALLKGLGFEVVQDPPDRALTQAQLLDSVVKMTTYRFAGRPALYKPITLLWAMGRALRDEPRLLAWTETEQALAALLGRHGAHGEKQRPDYPVASLCRDGIWTLPDHIGDVPTAHGDAKLRRWFAEHRPRGGLAEPVYDLFRHSAVTRLAVLDGLLGTFFDGLDPAPLLADVGLAELDQEEAAPAEPAQGEQGRPEPWLSLAAEYERGCRLIEQREARTGAGERDPRLTHRPKRSQAARYLVLSRSEGRCENPGCTGQPADVTDGRRPILEVDHVLDLALGGRDHPSQMVALCPNCHAVKTRGSTREELRGILLRVAEERHRSVLLRARPSLT